MVQGALTGAQDLKKLQQHKRLGKYPDRKIAFHSKCCHADTNDSTALGMCNQHKK